MQPDGFWHNTTRNICGRRGSGGTKCATFASLQKIGNIGSNPSSDLGMPTTKPGPSFFGGNYGSEVAAVIPQTFGEIVSTSHPERTISRELR